MRVRVLPDKKRSIIDIGAFREMPYLFFVISVFVGFMGLYLPFFYVQSFAIENHITNSNLGFYILAIMNATSAFGRIIPGFLSDKSKSLRNDFESGHALTLNSWTYERHDTLRFYFRCFMLLFNSRQKRCQLDSFGRTIWVFLWYLCFFSHCHRCTTLCAQSRQYWHQIGPVFWCRLFWTIDWYVISLFFISSYVYDSPVLTILKARLSVVLF